MFLILDNFFIQSCVFSTSAIFFYQNVARVYAKYNILLLNYIQNYFTRVEIFGKILFFFFSKIKFRE